MCKPTEIESVAPLPVAGAIRLVRSSGLACLLVFSLLAGPSWGQQADPSAEIPADLTSLSLESLMNIQVTSVSRHQQGLGTAAAAIHVITRDDIRRSGATSLADALKLAPGVQVARIDSSKWAVSIRGFAGRFANKLLVLMDGRSLYTPFFSGVFWDTHDTLLEDVERIEVIRGPGASLWGSNAVNGVINIITRNSSGTLGSLASVSAGSYEKGTAAVRHGFTLGDETDMRIYAKHLVRGDGALPDGSDADDSWQLSRAGFRSDSALNAYDSLTLSGDVYDGRYDETYTYYRLPTPANPDYDYVVDSTARDRGVNLMARWQRNLREKGSLSLQFYYEYSDRDMDILGERRNTFDAEFNHRVILDRHDVVWGLGYRLSRDAMRNTSIGRYDDESESTHHISGFVHDQITLIPQTLTLILGARLEHHNFTGYEFQPNARLSWTPSPERTVWAAVSRAVRIPFRGERDFKYRFLTLPPAPGLPLPLRLEIDGTDDFESETLLAYEVGFRTEPFSGFSFDIAAFYNIYDNLRVTEAGPVFLESPDNLAQIYLLRNDMEGRSYGFEIAASWTPMDWWRLQAAYSYIDLRMKMKKDYTDVINKGNAEGSTPQHQVSLRSGFDLARNVTLDLWLRGVDRVEYIDRQSIDGYATLDARLAWMPTRNLELSLVGQNLLDSHHPEFIPEFINTTPSEVERSVYAKVEWQF